MFVSGILVSAGWAGARPRSLLPDWLPWLLNLLASMEPRVSYKGHNTLCLRSLESVTGEGIDSMRLEDGVFTSALPPLASVFLPFCPLTFAFAPLCPHVVHTLKHRSGCPLELCMLQLPCCITFAFYCAHQCSSHLLMWLMDIDRLGNKCFLLIATGNYLKSIIWINCIYSVIIFSYFIIS